MANFKLILLAGVVLLATFSLPASGSILPFRQLPPDAEESHRALCELVFPAILASCRRDANVIYIDTPGGKVVSKINSLEQCCKLGELISCLRDASQSTCAPQDDPNYEWLEPFQEEFSAIGAVCAGQKPELCPNFVLKK